MSRPRMLLVAAASLVLLVCSGCDFEDVDQNGDGLITTDELITATVSLFCPPDETPSEQPPTEAPPATNPMEVEPTT